MTIEALCLLFSVSVILDTSLTYDWINFHNGREANPFWQNKLQHPVLVFTLDFSIMSGMTFAATEVGKKHKTLATVGMAALCIFQGYFLYRHLRVRELI